LACSASCLCSVLFKKATALIPVTRSAWAVHELLHRFGAYGGSGQFGSKRGLLQQFLSLWRGGGPIASVVCDQRRLNGGGCLKADPR
jgi:hypothetical protein